MQARLSAASLAEAMKRIHLGRETGLLHCAQPGAVRSLRFQRGELCHVLSDHKDERLGESLLRLGVISAAQLSEATSVLVRDRKRLGAVLFELGVLDLGQLQDALGRHVADVFGRVLACPEGQFSFETLDADAGGADDVRPRLQTGDLILEATRRLAPADATDSLGDLSRPLALEPGASMLAASLRLTPNEGFLLTRIDGSSARDTLSLLPGDPAEAERSLAGLLACGIAAWAAAMPALPARADDRPRVQRLPVVEGSTPAATPAGPAAGAESAAPDADAARREKQAELRRAIEEAYAKLGGVNHFEVLDLERGAAEAAIKEAYFRLARRFHPDSCNDEALADLRPKAEALFIRVGQAWDVLRNPPARADYEAHLPRPRPAPAPVPKAPEPPTPRTQALADEAEVARANDAVRQAEKLEVEGRFWDAIQLFEGSLEKASGVYPLRAQLGLARCYLKNPKWARRGEEQLHKAAEAFPRSPEPHYELAQLYRERGMKARAIAKLRRVLELKPEHEQAAAALAEVQGGNDPAGETPAPGLLGKLFRRK